MANDLKKLIKWLRGLHPTGADGFEGFLRDALTEVTGHTFGLAKSGPQGGVDVLQDEASNRFTIGLESKRYEKKKNLRLDSLKAKIVDAAFSYPALDLWLLAATCEIPAGDKKELVQIGEAQGIAVEILDWPLGPGKIPSLAILCVEAERTVAAHDSNGILPAGIIERIKRDPGYESARDRLLEKLTRSDVGYSSARVRLDEWTWKALQDPGEARARLHSYANLLDPDVTRVSRLTIAKSLDDWWALTRARPAALIGEEGMGKTWAVLDWWLTRKDSGNGLPLTLIIPAREVGKATDPKQLIAELLAKRICLRTADFWSKRLNMWERGATGKPKILLVVDGLNQHFPFLDWAGFFQPLLTSDARGFYAVAVTCRPDHWRTKLKQLCNLEPMPYEIDVGLFTMGELSEFLDRRVRDKAEFGRKLLDLMRVPRWCEMALSLSSELRDSGEITPTRLVMEDWKKRLHLHGALLAPDDEQFRSFVMSLGRRIRDEQLAGTGGAFSRYELFQELELETGHSKDRLDTALSEIIDGRWLARVEGTTRYRLDENHLPYALGLLLVEGVRGTATAAEVREYIGASMERTRGSDLGVSILRAATTIALLDSHCSMHVRYQLLEAWVTAQNFGVDDFEDLWRLIPDNPGLFCDLAENLWLDQSAGYQEDEAIIKGIANACERWVRVAEVVSLRTAAWLGMFWPDPDKGQFLGKYDPSTERAKAHCSQTMERWNQWTEIAGRVDSRFWPKNVECEGTSWLVHRVFGIISLLPRKVFVPSFVNWAISRAIMGRPRHFEEIAWVLRWNPYDPGETEQAVMVELDHLIALDHPLAANAACWLLEAMATPSAMAKALLLSVPVPQIRPRKCVVTVDPRTNRVTWDHQTALQWPRSQEIKLAAVRDLSKPALDPCSVLPDEEVELIASLPSDFPVERLWSRSDTVGEDIEFEGAQGVLARWAPQALGELIRRTFASVTERTAQGVRRLAWKLPEYLFVLGNNEIGLLCGLGRDPTEEVGDSVAAGHLLLAHLWQLPASRQIAVLANTPEGVYFRRDFRAALTPPTSKDLATVFEYLRHSDRVPDILRWLSYLTLVLKDGLLLPDTADFLFHLFDHPESTVRRLALQAAWQSANPKLIEAFACSGWTYETGMDQIEAAFGSLLLCEAAINTRIPRLRNRIDPQALAGRLSRASSPDFLSFFAAYVHEELDDFIHGRVNHVLASHWIFAQDANHAMELLLESHGEDVVSWLEPILKGAENPLWSFLGYFPFVPLTRALLRQRPEAGARLWSVLIDSREGGISQNPDFEILPIEGEEHPAVWEVREKMLGRAKTDADLIRIAATACKLGRENWLLNSLSGDLSSSNAGLIARAMTLAGFADVSSEWESLWTEQLSRPPAPGWLTQVHAWAHSHYQRNQWARHWFSCFLDEKSRDQAFGFYTLFLLCADRRVRSWVPKFIKSRGSEVPVIWKQHLSLSSSRLAKNIEGRDDSLKDTLYGTRKIGILAPWV